MAATTREEIASAFFALLEDSADFAGTSRRFVHWDKVDRSLMPYLTMIKTGERRERQEEGLPVLVLEYHVFLYTSAGMDPADVPDTAMNTLLDAIDAAITPSGADLLNGNKQTLGGLVSHCYPLGPSFVDTGDVDGKGVAAIPFEILASWR
jgi:hypothetical protein